MNWRERCILNQGDFRETLALADGTADLVFCSPPYADARTYGMDCNWTMKQYADLGDAVFAALRPGGHAVINVDAPVREWRAGFGAERGFHPWRIMLDWAERVGFRVPDRLAFGRNGMPGAYEGRFRNDWEPLLWFVKPGEGLWFDRWPLAQQSNSDQTGVLSSSRRPDGTMRVRRQSGIAVEKGVTHRGTLWNYGSVGHLHSGACDIEAENHPARWPYRLAEDIVRCFCPPDGLAVDPFVGAGTSAVAALEHKRRFLGGDLGIRTADETRGIDGVPWVTVTERVLDARFRQIRLFGG
jgi:DNA modification methylase